MSASVKPQPTELFWAYFGKRSQPRSSSIKLRNQIAERNQQLVRKVAHRMSLQCAEPYEDLEQIGHIGLIKAIERFEPDQGKAFSSFAVPYIEGEIRHYLRDHWGTVKVPRRTIEAVSKVKRLRRRLRNAGRDLSELEVAEGVGMSAARWEWSSQALSRKPLLDLHELQEALAAEGEDEEPDEMRTLVYSCLGELPNPYRFCIVETFFARMSIDAIARHHHMAVADITVYLQEGLARLKTQIQEAINV